MIRIDEIYNNTFWPWIDKNLPLTRMFFCDPFGHTKPENLFNHGHDVEELHYIFFHDQEPIHLGLHKELFDTVAFRNYDLTYKHPNSLQAIVTSEYQSEYTTKLANLYGWKNYYYFFHGWASLDWYRGYHRTFLIADPEHRDIKYSFISPNRIVGGRREHRLILFYHLFKHNIKNAMISFPSICPAENQPITEIAQQHVKEYPDIIDALEMANLPWNFPNETGHPMHSCWLSLFDECSQSMCHVITETVYDGRRNHLTEKTFKPICLQMPFVMVSTAGSMEYLRRYGFQTFGDVWDESYDQEVNDARRLEKIADLLAYLDSCSRQELSKIYQHCLPAVRHNYQHFYGGGFEKILWRELENMLLQIKKDWH
jgi:hypothetical protein